MDSSFLKGYKLRHMTVKEIRPVAEMLADTFFENSVYSSIFTVPNKRREGLKWLFERNLRLYLKMNCTRIVTAVDVDEVNDASEVIGTLSWVPPAGLGINFLDYIKVGLLLMPFRFGLDAMKRMLYYMNANDSEVNASIGNQPHWYLGMVAVQKSCRGKGIGTAMIKEHLENIIDAVTDVNADGIKINHFPVLLTTQNESNVGLYSNLGFNVVMEESFGYGDAKFHSWCMMRRPNIPNQHS